ncbi:MAG: YihY/virulence factor BrkB family protein [Bacteroidota bacterium]|nr:YihY/virulence factor BrkB family protein [Bacteroidota bacterium]
MKRLEACIPTFMRHLVSRTGIRAVWMYLNRLMERMEDNHIFLSGAAIAFNSMLCFIPLVLVLFYILGLYLDSAAAMRTIDGYLDSLRLFPYEREYIRSRVLTLILDFVRGSHIAGVVGIIGLAWTSSALFATMRTVLNRIFNVRDTRSIVFSKIKDLALLSLVGISLVLITTLSYGLTLVKGVAAQLAGEYFQHWFLQGTFIHVSSTLVNFFLFCVIFLLIPDRRLPVRVVALSSAVAAVLWAVAKALFSYYASNLWSMGKIYGPYAVIVATAVWVYYSSVTILLAAEIGQMAMERRSLRKLFTQESMRNVVRSLGIESNVESHECNAERGGNTFR